jgi:hypothetical protein
LFNRAADIEQPSNKNICNKAIPVRTGLITRPPHARKLESTDDSGLLSPPFQSQSLPKLIDTRVSLSATADKTARIVKDKNGISAAQQEALWGNKAAGRPRIALRIFQISE